MSEKSSIIKSYKDYMKKTKRDKKQDDAKERDDWRVGDHDPEHG